MDTRATDPYRQTLNKSQIPCLGVTEYLDPKSVVYPAHKTLGINFADIPQPTSSPTGVNRRCDACLGLQEMVKKVYFEAHPDEEHPNLRRSYGNRSFIYKGQDLGVIIQSNIILHVGGRFKYNYPDTYTQITEKSKKPIRTLTTEEFYAYLDSILERDTNT